MAIDLIAQTGLSSLPVIYYLEQLFRQMTFMATINQLIQKNSQFIIATHSPILLSYPNSTIYRVSEDGFNLINYEETDAYQITQAFLKNPNRMFRELFK
ncbi:hypothetical protein [Shewanella algae]|uniref:hypothetical protein n=1 Tax=Shewanella algae TaxID=38313 RepID=UPI0012FE5FD6|nr:hypothetical protein [Shewanella algae]